MSLTRQATAPRSSFPIAVHVQATVNGSQNSPQPGESSAPYKSLLHRNMRGLDAVRGLAVVMVVCYHGFAIDLPHAGAVSRAASLLGVLNADLWLGVNLFFVLSGFLITGILLDTKHHQTYYKSFYLRRLLRILPLYLVVLVAAKAQLGLGKAYLAMCLFYVANLDTYFSHIGPTYGPLWSLAVEEQFYLLWPFVVRTCSKKVFAGVCLAVVVVSPLLRALAHEPYHWLGSPRFTTWLISDNLAWGALLAVALRSARATRQRLQAAVLALGVTGGLLLAGLVTSHQFSRRTTTGEALQIVPFLLFSTALLGLALLVGERTSVLRYTAPLRFLGYISYGLYLIHTLVYYAFDALFVRLHGPIAVLSPALLLTRFVSVILFSVALATISRRTYEEVFLRMKNKLAPY